jgi:FKBP-type peptidyl-prolyl cis-trans isomerase FklB
MNTKAIVLMILTGALTAPGIRAEEAAFKNDKDKISYVLGVYYGGDWKRREMELNDLNYDEFLRGLKTMLAGEKSAVTDQEIRDSLNQFQTNLTARVQEKRRIAGEKNKAEGEQFLAENKAKPGVVTLPSGLQYKVLIEGAGDSPKPEDNVTVNYRGTLIDGTEFDSSYKRGQPAKFRVTGVIPGWTEALTKMKPGGKWQLFIPSNLAYGERGNQNIAPNATLLFEVELVSAEPPPPPATPAAPLTSDIIKVPSLEEMKKGAKIETIKAEDVEKLQKQQQAQPEKK